MNRPFAIHTNGFTPNKCCLSIPYLLNPPGSQRIQSHILRNVLGGLICAPFHISAQALSEEGRQGRNTVPRGVTTGTCVSVTAQRGPFTALGCPLLRCSKNTSIKSSLGFLTRPTSLPGADPPGSTRVTVKNSGQQDKGGDQRCLVTSAHGCSKSWCGYL